MSPDQSQLWQRIAGHALDHPTSASPFSLRLAKENGWLPGFTQRAIAEYRRFVFLAVAAGHPVSPSDAVDQVWHLHLLYTRDYWGEFCGRTLGVPLHHGPTRGGADEADKFTDWYAKTLASYRRFFGEPPADLWPARTSHPDAVRVDRQRHWIIRRPSLRGWFERVRPSRIQTRSPEAQVGAVPLLRKVGHALPALLLPALLSLIPSRANAAPGAALPWPFDLPGPEFLAVFPVIAAVVFGAALVWRRRLRVPLDDDSAARLDPYATALLAGGPQRAFIAALASVTQSGWVTLAEGKVVRTEAPLPGSLPLLERAICAAARADGTKIADVRLAATDALTSIRDGLAEKGLLMHGATQEAARWQPCFLALAVPLAGFVKILVGVDRHRPVGFLIFFSIAALVAALAFLRTPRRSQRGDGVVERLQREHLGLQSVRPAMLTGADAAWVVPIAVGLWGADVLQGTTLEPVTRELTEAKAARDGGGGCGTVASSCGGGGGGGGCGGGGCGGCGGGGD